MKPSPVTLAKLLLVCCSPLAFFQPLSAEIVDDGGYTTDTASGLQWLDLDATWGNSDSQIRARLAAGGNLYAQGWKWATRNEVRTFWANAGVVESESYPINTGSETLAYSNAIADLMDLIKGSRAAGSANFIPLDFNPMRGITVDGPDPLNGYAPFLNRFFFPALATGRWYGVAWSGYDVDRSISSPDMGYWLQRPIPSDPVIAVIGIHSDSPDEFAWVPLRDLQEGEQFYFTDAGYFNSLGTFYDGGSTAEWLARYTVPRGGLPAGAVQVVGNDLTPDYEFINGTNLGEDLGSIAFGIAGEQVIVFQSDDDPFAGPSFTSTDFRPIFAATSHSQNWVTTVSEDFGQSNLPPGFRDGVDAVAAGEGPLARDDWDNIRYEGPTSGSPLTLLVAISDAANWTGTVSAQVDGPNNGITTFNVSGISRPEIAVYEGPDLSGAELSDNSGTVDFGTVEIDLTSSTRTFTIRNNGVFDLTGIAVTSDNPTVFSVDSSSTLGTLGKLESTTFTVTFATAIEGPFAAVIQIDSNDSDEASFEIPVTGSGFTPPPTVVENLANMPINLSELTIAGTTFDPSSPGNNSVVFTPAGTGTVSSATTTSLTVTDLSGLVEGPLSAVVTTNGQVSGSPVQIANLLAAPVVTETTPDLSVEINTLTIIGSNFDELTPANNVVTFSPSGTGVVTASTSTSLTVSGVNGLTGGPLSAVVNTLGQPSGAPVQVGNVIAPPSVTSRSFFLQTDSDTMIIYGANFDASTPGNNIVTFSPSGTGVVTAATANSLTVTGLSGLDLGALSVTVTVVSGEGLTSGSPVEIATVLTNPVSTQVVDFGNGPSFGQDNSQAIVNGHPAVAYYESGEGSLLFARNSQPDGSGTWDTAVVDYQGDVGRHCSLAIVAGRPAISYYDASGGALKYVRANDAEGSDWPEALVIDSSADVGQFTTLRGAAGHPAISYYDVTNQDLKYVRALDFNGATWGVPIVLDSTDQVGSFASMEIVNGRPFICYYDATNDDLKLVKSNDAAGQQSNDWGTPFVLDANAGTSGTWSDLAVINGNPAISYLAAGGLSYIIGLNDGTSWTAPLVLDTTARYCSMTEVDGKPAISYARGSDDLWFVHATDANGFNAWSAPQLLDGARLGGTYGSLLEVAGQPAITYQRGVGTGQFQLGFLRAINIAGAIWPSSPETILGSSFTGNVGRYSSQAIVNGHPAVCYWDSTTEELRYVRASDPQGLSWGEPISVNPNSRDDIGSYCSLAVVNGHPAISYYNADDDDLEFVRANDANGSTWGFIEKVDTTGNVGQYTSLAFINGIPCISYYDRTNFDLKFARASNSDGSNWSSSRIEVVDDSGGTFTSLVEVNGRPAISYTVGGVINYVLAANTSGSSWRTPTPVDPATSASESSLSVVNGSPAISYYDNANQSLKYIRLNNTGWGPAVTVDNTGQVGEDNSLAVVNGKPAISYYDQGNNALKFVTATDADGASWAPPETFDDSLPVEPYTSLVDVNGVPGISYYDDTQGDLKWATYGDLPAAPTVTPASTSLPLDSTTLTITGSGFDSLGLGINQVSFSPSGTGIVTDATGTSLTVSHLSGLTLGPLGAVVVSQGQDSGPPVQVAILEAPAEVNSPSVADVDRVSATLGGSVVSALPASITGRGVVYSITSESADPRLSDSNVVQVPTVGSAGSFTITVAGLAPATEYSFKAYATTALGVTYSSVASFTTASNSEPSFSGFTIGSGYEVAVAIPESTILNGASDPDGDSLSITSVGTSGQGGTVTFDSGSINYSPPEGFSGSDTFLVTITDEFGGSATGTVTVIVNAPLVLDENGELPPVRIENGQVGLGFKVPPGTYLLERSTDLANWVTLITLVAGPDNCVTYTDLAAPDDGAFYRLLVL